VTPEERFVVEELAPDQRGRRIWGLRDRATGQLVEAGDEVNVFFTPASAAGHRLTYHYLAERAEDTDA
jgi:hypothetical protein